MFRLLGKIVFFFMIVCIVMKLGDMILGLLFIEKSLYISGPFYDVSIYQMDTPHQWRTSYSVNKRKGIFRILVLGDSFGFGYGLKNGEVNISQQLEDELKKSRKDAYEVINLSRLGNGPKEYLNAYMRVGRKLKPDLVVVLFFIGNDIMNVKDPYLRGPFLVLNRIRILLDGLFPNIFRIKNIGFQYFMPRWQRMEVEKEKRRSVSVSTTTSNKTPRSAVPPTGLTVLSEKKMILAGFREGISAEEIRKRLKSYNQELLALGREDKENYLVMQSAMLHPQIIEDTILLESESIRKSWLATKQVLNRLVKKSNNDGVKTVILGIPASVQVDKKYWDYYVRMNFIVSDRMLKDPRINRELSEFCIQRGVAMLDMLPIFRNYKSERLYSNVSDCHFTYAGCRVVAQELAKLIRDMAK